MGDLDAENWLQKCHRNRIIFRNGHRNVLLSAEQNPPENPYLKAPPILVSFWNRRMNEKLQKTHRNESISVETLRLLQK